MSSSTTSREPQRRSSRRRRIPNAATRPPRNVPFSAFHPPWAQHYIDVGHCRWQKCTARVQNARDSDMEHIKISFLAMAITASAAYTPKYRQERALIEYTQAVKSRGIDPNDYHRGRSAVAAAAYYGYKDLLQLLLQDEKCIINRGHPNALHAVIMNSQHECMAILFEQRKKEVCAMLEEEASKVDDGMPRRGLGRSTALRLAIQRKDTEAVRLLREKGKAMVSDIDGLKTMPSLVRVLQDLYSNETIVLSWSQHLHWSFPLSDRRMINIMWHHMKKEAWDRDGNSLPGELWLRIFSFIGRGWWWNT